MVVFREKVEFKAPQKRRKIIMKRIPGFMSGFLTAVLIIALCLPAFASTVRQLNANYSGIKITLDGAEIIPTDANGATVEPFTVDGTTYLPVRAIANALGLAVEWDGTTQTVKLTKPVPQTETKVVYEDDRVTISFSGCIDRNKTDSYSIGFENFSEARFQVTNKTNSELTFQPSAISFDGISYQFLGSESVAANSTGMISFFTTDAGISIGGYTNISGKISVIDFSKNWDDPLYSYDASWVDVYVG